MSQKYIDKKNMHQNPEEMVRVLDIDGILIDKNFKTSLSKDEIKEGYRFMVLSRQQDTYMSQLQRQGRMLTFAPNFGEEALQVASGMALKKDDWFVPAFRSNATMLYLGVPLKNQMLYWNGQERGSLMPEGVNVLPINIPIATQCAHAAGLAYAMKLTGKKNVSVSFIGNGGTAEGEFYESMNISAIHKWPTIFCVNNNQWSISTPDHLESASATIAAKGIAAGVPAVRVDGNDLIASYEVMKEAREYSIENGPVLIEFITWREGPHTTSDNPRIYRTEEAEKNAEKWEPYHRIERYMADNGIMNETEKDKVWADALAEVKVAYEATTDELDSTLDEVFDHTLDKLPAELQEQKDEAIAYFKGGK